MQFQQRRIDSGLLRNNVLFASEKTAKRKNIPEIIQKNRFTVMQTEPSRQYTIDIYNNNK